MSVAAVRCLSLRFYSRSLLLRRPLSAVVNHMPSFHTAHSNLLLLHEDPPVYEVKHFISDTVCDEIIESAKMFGDKVDISRTFLLQKATPPTLDNNSAVENTSLSQATRNSTTWYLDNSRVAHLLSEISTLTGRSISTFEEPQVVRYLPGQRYAWHQDAIPQGRVNAHAGNRLATVIVYLNDLPESGGSGATGSDARGASAANDSTEESIALSGYTSFRDFKLDIKPEKGKCIVFFPCFADGTPDHRTAHCSHAVVGEGVEKWIAQVWVHQRPYLY